MPRNIFSDDLVFKNLGIGRAMCVKRNAVR